MFKVFAGLFDDIHCILYTYSFKEETSKGIKPYDFSLSFCAVIYNLLKFIKTRFSIVICYSSKNIRRNSKV